MPRYIDIDKMNMWTEVDQESCSRENCASTDYDCNECYYNNGGSEDVAPVIHSKWGTSYFEDGYKVNMTCLNCGEHFSADYNDTNKYNYCPNCNAKMDKE